jgi:hypothetical protein
VVRLGHRRDLPQLLDAADVAHVGVDDVGRAPLEDLAELEPRVELLAGDDRNADLAPALGQGAETGSSYQNGSNGSSSLATRTACIGASRRCTSISRSTPAPTASRTARTVSTTCRSASRVMCVRHGPGNGSNFSALKPRATVALAFAA